MHAYLHHSLRFLAATSLAAPLWAQNPSLQLELPSFSTQPFGGNLVLQLNWPGGASMPRHGDDGAPIVIYVPGGFGSGSLQAVTELQDLVNEGCLTIQFLFPGGQSGGSSSGGAYDARGPASQLALADVTRYALGLIPDSSGMTLPERFSFANTANVGYLASSAGGVVTTNMLARLGRFLPGDLWFVGWENPTSGQSLLLELGSIGMDPNLNRDGDNNGLNRDDGKNTSYKRYSDSILLIDYRSMIFDANTLTEYNDVVGAEPALETGTVVLDRDGDGTASFRLGAGGRRIYDLDNNGLVDSYEDFPLNGQAASVNGRNRIYLSPEARSSADLLGVSLPAEFASTLECQLYWEERGNQGHSYLAGLAKPGLRSLLVYGRQDHASPSADKAHVQQAYDGLLAAGSWVRLNPDLSYVAEVFGGEAPAGTREAPANLVVPYGKLHKGGYPIGFGRRNFLVAGVLEMVDRTWSEDWTPDLD